MILDSIKITDGDQTRYGFFKVAEFHPNSNPRAADDSVGTFYLPAILLDAANMMRDALGEPINVNSTIRSIEKNNRVGGAKGSLHLPYVEGGKTFTRAIDLGIGTGIKDLHALIVNNGPLAQELREMGVGGIGLYDTFIHLDIGEVRMWDNRVSTKVGKFNPTLIYYNLVNYLKKKDDEEQHDLPEDFAEGFFRNPWFFLIVVFIVYIKFFKR